MLFSSSCSVKLCVAHFDNCSVILCQFQVEMERTLFRSKVFA